MLLRIIALSFFLPSVLFGQLPENIQRYRADKQGDFKNRRQGILDGNRVRTIYYNTGEIAQWPYAPSGEWPKGSGHQYLDGVTVLIAAKVTAPGDGQTIHPLEAEYREEMSRDPVTGQIWGLEPVEGYFQQSSSTSARSDDPTSWPSQWPPALGLPPDYNGHWCGYFGKDSFHADLETYFVMDDSKDQKFTRLPHHYFPIASDTTRGGLGLRVETRTFQWQNQFLHDVIFLNYDVWNISDYDYDSTAFGFYIDAGVGGVGSGNDDAGVDSQLDLAYAWDHNQKGDPAFGDWKPGYFGMGIVGSPGNPNPLGMTSFGAYPLSDKGPNGVWPKNNEVMWKKMTSGFVDTVIVNSNISMIVGSGTFAFEKWKKAQYTAAIVMGTDIPDILFKKSVAQITFDNNFTVPDSLSQVGTLPITLQSPSPGSTVSGSVNIHWTVEGNTGNTLISYSNNGIEWNYLATVAANSNSYAWDSKTVPDGIFYKLRLLALSSNGIGVTESEKFFTVNNPGNGAPQIILDVSGERMTLNGTYQVRWHAGDPDGDSCRVSLYYKLKSEPAWTTIALQLPSSLGKYNWSTGNVPNSSSFDYQLKAEVTSLSDTGSSIVENISIINPVIYSSGEPYIISKKSNGTGKFDIVVVDSFAVTGHTYLLAFYKAGGGDSVACDVVDVNTGTTKLSVVNLFDGFHETKYFDGIRLKIQSDATAVDVAGTGWSAGTSTLKMIPGPDLSSPAINKQSPYDYQFAFANTPVDTAFSDGSDVFPPMPVNFSIMNLTTRAHTKFIVEDDDRTKTLTQGDVIRIIEPDTINIGDLFLTWEIKYGDGSLNVVYPKAGDIYVLKTKKPFAAGDSIVFTTQGLTSVKQNNEVIPSSFELAQNYPNPFNPATTIRFRIPVSNVVTLKIYSVLGKEVATLLSGRLKAGEYSVRWNAETMPSGVYFYSLRSGSSSATKKLILLK